MKLLELKLKNFKGIKKLELKGDGNSLRIYGNNATGKTTLFDAFTWLFFNTDSKNKTEFGIKTWDPNGDVLHHLDHEVEGKFSVDGEIIELKKVYREKWVKRRGATDRTFDGHETDHFVDGVPLTKAEYDARIKDIAPEKHFRLLTSPAYFNEQLHWSERREILLEVCGDVTDEDVIKANEKLASLPKILGKRTLEEHKKVIASRRFEINKELERIPVRIDEAHKALPDISAIEDPDEIESNLAKLAKERIAKERELADLISGGNIGEMRQKIAELDAGLISIETAYRREHAKRVAKIEDDIQGVQGNIRDAQRVISMRKVDLEHAQKAAERLRESIEALRAEWHEVNAQQLNLDVQDTCPTCGQGLPAGQIQAAKDKATSDFNSKKAKQLAEINGAGKANREELEKLEAESTELKATIKELESTLVIMAEDHAGLQKDLAKVKAAFEDYKEQDNYKKLTEQKDKLQKQLDGEQVDITPEKERIEADIAKLEEAADDIRTAKANVEAYEKGQKRIAELEHDQRQLAEEFESLEEQLYLIEEFIRTKVTLLTDKINSKFKVARFKLFEEQVNGAIKEVCETTLNGVPWSDLNTGGSINVGLDIINTLSEHYGFAPPVFVDNAESITRLTDIDAQLITLVVSEKDKSLRVEGTGDMEPSLMQEVGLFQEAM